MPRSVSHRLVPTTVVPAGLRQIAAVIAIGATGTCALAVGAAVSPHGATLAADRPAAASAAPPAAVPQAQPAPLRRAERPAMAPAHVPAPPRRPAAHGAPGPVHRVVRPRTSVARWLPSGTGMWIYEWGRTAHGRAPVVVHHAEKHGITTLFIRTGSSHDGYRGDPLLGRLLPATRGTDVRIVAWDFPELTNPVADARRLARTAWYNRRLRSYPHVAAVAPDIETPSEGASSSARRVQAYLTTLRRLLPPDVSILTTIPWPSPERVGHYPYATVARYSDALLPMAYWYNNSPRLVTARTMTYLAQFHRPVQPVGQGYDGHQEWHWLPHNNLQAQVPEFLATAHRFGASAVSIWSWQSAPPATWLAVRAARGLFGARR